MNRFDDASKILMERFGHDCMISVATTAGDQPYVRTVDGYYEDGAIYAVTYTLSKKMKQIAANPKVAVCGDWFTALGTGENLGHVLDARNAAMMEKLRKAFAGWYEGGHVDEKDPNTCLLRVTLTTGLLIDHEGKYGVGRYEVDFTNRTARG